MKKGRFQVAVVGQAKRTSKREAKGSMTFKGAVSQYQEYQYQESILFENNTNKFC